MLAVDVRYADRVVKEFVQEHGQELLPFRILEILEGDRRKLSKKDRVLAGLRYSEFVDEDGTAESLWAASELMSEIAMKHGIDVGQLITKLRDLGWH